MYIYICQYENKNELNTKEFDFHKLLSHSFLQFLSDLIKRFVFFAEKIKRTKISESSTCYCNNKKCNMRKNNFFSARFHDKIDVDIVLHFFFHW